MEITISGTVNKIQGSLIHSNGELFMEFLVMTKWGLFPVIINGEDFDKHNISVRCGILINGILKSEEKFNRQVLFIEVVSFVLDKSLI